METENPNINIIYHGLKDLDEIKGIFKNSPNFRINFFIVSGIDKPKRFLQILQKKAYKKGINFLTFKTFKQAVNIINPDKIYVVEGMKNKFNPIKIAKELNLDKTIVFVFNTYPKTDKEVETIGIGKPLSNDNILSIILYEIEKIWRYGVSDG